MRTDLATQIMGYVSDGGWVMGPLVIATFVLWCVLGWRIVSVRRGSRRTLRALWRDRASVLGRAGVVPEAIAIASWAIAQRGVDVRGIMDEHLAPIEDRLERGASLVRSIVMVAPLTGLLGTVGGMIETFDSLADMALFTQSGGIAGGISQALITTQMGLAIAIPGLIIGRILERRGHKLSEEIEEIKALACQLAAPPQETP